MNNKFKDTKNIKEISNKENKIEILENELSNLELTLGKIEKSIDVSNAMAKIGLYGLILSFLSFSTSTVFLNPNSLILFINAFNLSISAISATTISYFGISSIIMNNKVKKCESQILSVKKIKSDYEKEFEKNKNGKELEIVNYTKKVNFENEINLKMHPINSNMQTSENVKVKKMVLQKK